MVFSGKSNSLFGAMSLDGPDQWLDPAEAVSGNVLANAHATTTLNCIWNPRGSSSGRQHDEHDSRIVYGTS